MFTNPQHKKNGLKKESHNVLEHTRLLQNLWGDPPLAMDNTKNEKRIIHLLKIGAIHLYFTDVADFIFNKHMFLCKYFRYSETVIKLEFISE